MKFTRGRSYSGPYTPGGLINTLNTPSAVACIRQLSMAPDCWYDPHRPLLAHQTVILHVMGRPCESTTLPLKRWVPPANMPLAGGLSGTIILQHLSKTFSARDPLGKPWRSLA